MRQSISKAATRRFSALLVVIPVLIIASAFAGAATSTPSTPRHASSTKLLQTSTKFDPVAQMSRYGKRIRLREGRALYRALLKERRAAHKRKLARERARRQRQAAQQVASTASSGGSTANATLQAIAACESGGEPKTDTGNGFYGKYQFTQSTWESVGGVGNPAQAPEGLQDELAAALLEKSGASPWPKCGR